MFLDSTFCTLQSGIEEGMQYHIDKCFALLQHLGCTIDWELQNITSTPDGVTMMKGWYRLININGQVIHNNSYFSCGSVSYIFKLKNITPEFCFRCNISRAVFQGFT